MVLTIRIDERVFARRFGVVPVYGACKAVEETLVEAAQLGCFTDPRFTAREQLAIRYAENMHTRVGLNQAFADEMLFVYSEAEFIELALCVAQFISMGQLIRG